MAPSGRIFLIVVLILVIHLTEPKDGYSGLARSRGRRSSSTRRTVRTYTRTYSTGGTYGGGLSWWQICLIIGGTLLAFFVMYCGIRACRREEPESDTPGIQSTRDQIQLRDHQTINHFPTPNYQLLPSSEGKEIPPPPQMQHHPVPAPYGGQPLPPQPGFNVAAPPPSYDAALEINKDPIGEGVPDRWEDQDGQQINRKDFGVL